MITIKRNSVEYEFWLKRRNAKNLKIRTKKRLEQKGRETRKIQYNFELKNQNSYHEPTHEFTFSAPRCFSFIKNLEETSLFFNKVISFISNSKNFGKKIFIDISSITDLTTDALMYLLAVVNNLNEHFCNRYRFSGNSPMDREINKQFRESGFFRYVNYRGGVPPSSNSDTIKIVSGNNSNTEIAKQVSDFIAEKAGVSINVCKFIYVMMIELMSNTNKHAYNDNDILAAHWYCFVEYDKKDKIFFTFMDVGAGIPTTVRKNFSEKLDILKVKGDDKYVISALNGEFRSATNKSYRGKGLPKIRNICKEGKLKNMRIITNSADVHVGEEDYSSNEIHQPLKGTLYNWQVNISDLKGA